MISKLSTWGPDRIAAIDAMGRALENFHIEGLGQNIPFLAAVMDQGRFRSGELSTSYIKDEFPEGFQGTAPDDFQKDLMTAVACAMHRAIAGRAAGGRLRDDWVVIGAGEHRPVLIQTTNDGLKVDILDEGRALSLGQSDWRPGLPVFRGVVDGRAFACAVQPAAEGYVIRHRAATRRILVLSPRSAQLHDMLPPKKAADTSKLVISPMPGLVVSLDVEAGQSVRSGEQVAIIEAMKMQNIIRAERDGVVKAVLVASGASVAADEVLIEFG
jgi:propionyl-CoA carboxylase alpha chain